MATLSPPPLSLLVLPIFDVFFELFVAVSDLSFVHVGTGFCDTIPFPNREAFGWWSIPLDLLVFWWVRKDVTPSRFPSVIIHLFSLRLGEGQTQDFSWTRKVSTGRGVNPRNILPLGVQESRIMCPLRLRGGKTRRGQWYACFLKDPSIFAGVSGVSCCSMTIWIFSSCARICSSFAWVSGNNTSGDVLASF